MHPLQENCTTRYFLLDRHRIHTLRFILEAYEGIAVLTTVDQNLGLVKVNVAPGCEDEVRTILCSEAESLGLRPLDVAEVRRLQAKPREPQTP